MADEDIREGAPNKAKKKKPLPPKDDEERPRKKRPVDEDDEEADERPRKKRPVDDDDDEDDEAPRKKKKAVKEEPDEDEDDSGGSALSALIPVGGSVFALVSLWSGVFSFLPALVSLLLVLKRVDMWGVANFPPVLGCILPILWPIAILSGGLAFFTHKSKSSYGSIAGNMRAIIGILLGLVAMLLHVFLIYLYFKG
ncbi:MAG: hypothetical protein HYR84_10115 [Planctomycetes bacterium]|nr:hypothetical protein [Planctomycetota bacterium]